MKLLSGTELAGYVKERQAKQVRSFRQSHDIHPKLAIIKVIDDPVINTYVELKKQYGQDIGVEVDLHDIGQNELFDRIDLLNNDASVQGIIVQLPMGSGVKVDEVLNAVDASKDVDGLNSSSDFTAATALSIGWLLDGYNVDLKGKKIALVGRGRLVGAPLEKDLVSKGLLVNVLEYGDELPGSLLQADVVISATGVPGLIDSSMIKEKAVAIDAGVATAEGKTVGDFDLSVYARDDLTVTPKKGGVGPLTVSALFENLLRACSKLV